MRTDVRFTTSFYLVLLNEGVFQKGFNLWPGAGAVSCAPSRGGARFRRAREQERWPSGAASECGLAPRQLPCLKHDSQARIIQVPAGSLRAHPWRECDGRPPDPPRGGRGVPRRGLQVPSLGGAGPARTEGARQPPASRSRSSPGEGGWGEKNSSESMTV